MKRGDYVLYINIKSNYSKIKKVLLKVIIVNNAG